MTDLAQLDSYCITGENCLRDVIACIDRNQKGIALVRDGMNHLVGTITDGDIRRAMLAGKSLDVPVTELLAAKTNSPYSRPVSAPVGMDRIEMLKLMRQHSLRQIPLLDHDDKIAGLVTLDELVPEGAPPVRAVIMAGGMGTRLLPLTQSLPKPMLPVGDQPLIEVILGQLRRSGIDNVSITTHYLAEKITEHLGDGERFGLKLDYVTEERPLGTAGSLRLLNRKAGPLLVINGDILTSLDFRSLWAFHQDHKADLTIAVRQYSFKVPYGVVTGDGARVTGITEKPELQFFVNAGIYLLEPTVHRYVPEDRHFDMTDLIKALLDDGATVINFPVREYWLDVGHIDDYLQAQKDIKTTVFKS